VTIVHISGVDPGLVNTGIVGITLDSDKKTIRVLHHVLQGTDLDAALRHFTYPSLMADSRIFIEKYRDRGTSFTTHSEMRAFETKLKGVLPQSVVLDNTGVKKVVTGKMLDAIVGKLPTTNHRDLESAARIAIAGALKDPVDNRVFYEALTAHKEGQPWARL
jgi:hypothetical protein